MSGRADAAHPGDSEPPPHGSAGPADPHTDPATDPALRPAAVAAPGKAGSVRRTGRTRFSGLWVGLILSALVLIFLLIFILQNLEPVQIEFLGATGVLPTGVALLLAAIAGVLLVAIPGTGRIVQLRQAARRGARRTR